MLRVADHRQHLAAIRSPKPLDALQHLPLFPVLRQRLRALHVKETDELLHIFALELFVAIGER